MARVRRERGGSRQGGFSRFRTGVIALVVVAVASYFGFTKANPFANPYELHAVFDNVNNLKPQSPVRIAGVDVGKVTEVEPVTEGEGAARVTMEIKEKGLPIHQDARLKVRARIFLEGNFFVELQPGSPSAPEATDGATIPMSQTAAPVQIGQVLTALQSDTREDLQTFLREYSRGLEGEGARGFNQSIRYWETAYRNSALAGDATLGQQPSEDLRRVLRGQQRTFAALAADEEALKRLVTNLNVTAGAFAREDVALERSVPALRDTLRAAQPALASLNDSLPSLRAFAVDALPGTRSANPTLAAALPFISQARRLVGRRELRGLASELRRRVPALVDLTDQSAALSGEARQLSACTNNVLVPLSGSEIHDPDFPANSGQRVIEQIQRTFVGLGGESRTFDANTPYYHTQVTSPLAIHGVRPVGPPDGGVTPPQHRPDVPCETQEPPNLNAPGGSLTQFERSVGPRRGRRYSRADLTRAYGAEKRRLSRLWRKQRRLEARTRERATR
jgi:phospholipid/cholesterol/gamma-HCH transport system substrate-binding protein